MSLVSCLRNKENTIYKINSLVLCLAIEEISRRKRAFFINLVKAKSSFDILNLDKIDPKIHNQDTCETFSI